MPPMNRITVERTALIERVREIAKDDAGHYAVALDEYKADQARVKRAKKKRAAVIERAFWRAANEVEDFGSFRIYGSRDRVEFGFDVDLGRDLNNECADKVAKPTDPARAHAKALRILEMSVDPTIQIAVNGDFARYL